MSVPGRESVCLRWPGYSIAGDSWFGIRNTFAWTDVVLRGTLMRGLTKHEFLSTVQGVATDDYLEHTGPATLGLG